MSTPKPTRRWSSSNRHRHARNRTMPSEFFERVTSSSVLDSPITKAVTDGSVRLRAARAGAQRIRRRSSAFKALYEQNKSAENIVTDMGASLTSAGGGESLFTDNGAVKEPQSQRSRTASAIFWAAGESAMPEDSNLNRHEVEELTRRHDLSVDMLEVELQQKDAELSMAAEIGLKLLKTSEATAAHVKDLEEQVRTQARELEELEMENKVMQRKYLAQRKHLEKISDENVNLTTEVAQVDALRDQLSEAQHALLALKAYSRPSTTQSQISDSSAVEEMGYSGSTGAKHFATKLDGQAQEDAAMANSHNRIVWVSPMVPSFAYSNSQRSEDEQSRQVKAPTGNNTTTTSGDYVRRVSSVSSANSGSDQYNREEDQHDHYGMDDGSDEETKSGGDAHEEVLIRIHDIRKMEAICEQLQKDVETYKQREITAKEAVEHVKKELDTANKLNSQLRFDGEQLQIEIETGREALTAGRKDIETLRAQLEEDQEIITVLRSRVTTLNDEIEELERSISISASSLGDASLSLDKDVESSKDMASDLSIAPVQQNTSKTVGEGSTEADDGSQNCMKNSEDEIDRQKELNERLVEKLRSQTDQLMNVQTELNSAENQLQLYEQLVADWRKQKRPEFKVKGDINEEGGFVVYELKMLQEEKECHIVSYRYSNIAAFRSQLKRKLFVADQSNVRLPALPPKVWGNSRSRSKEVVQQREVGIQKFLNIMLALAELSELLGTEFFKWLGWSQLDIDEGSEGDFGGKQKVTNLDS